MKSTASPGRGVSRRGRSYKPWPPGETPPDQHIHTHTVERLHLGSAGF